MTDHNNPTIQVEGAALPGIVCEAEQHLLESGAPVYQRDGKLIRIGRFPIHDGKPDLHFVEICKDGLVEILTSIITWRKMEGKTEKSVACPGQVAATYLARSGMWRVPVIRAVITAPTLRPDESVLDQPGYDKATGLFYDPQGVKFPDIPLNPTKQDARECLDTLIGLVSEVPFVVDDEHGAVSRSVFLSSLLSALIRTMLPAVPLHGFSSPTPGSGKSILVNGVTYLLTGNPASPITQGGEDETVKTLSSALQAGYAVISLDNCETPIGGAMLCQAVSEPYLSVRVFGKTELKKITNTAMYFATGNNLTFTGDIVRRALRCKIDAQCERPEDRKFKTTRPDIAMRENRVEIVMAGLIVLRAFFAAGCPSRTEPVGTFEKWSTTVRDCLIWLGEPDPWFSTETIRNEDPQIENNIAALHVWHDSFGTDKKTSKVVMDAVNAKTESTMGSLPKFVNSALRDALQVVTNNDLNSRCIGNWLSSIKDRPIGGFIAVQAGKLDGNMQWRVHTTAKQDSPNHSMFE